MNYEERRLAFAVIDGVVVFQKNNARKCSKEWLMQDLGLSKTDYETTIRGGLFEDRITLSRGSNYDAVPLDCLSAAIHSSLLKPPYILSIYQFPVSDLCVYST